jgi:hypothetical protein
MDKALFKKLAVNLMCNYRLITSPNLTLTEKLGPNFSFLYIEISRRRKGATLVEIKDILKERKGICPEVIFYRLPRRKSAYADVLLSLARE